MANLIVTDPIPGGSVYGVAQAGYTVDGVSGKDFIDAVTAASFRQSVAIETAASGYVSVVRARQTKMDEVGQALAYLSKAVASLKTKGGKSTDKVTVDNASWVKSIASKYGISLSWESGGTQMTRGNVMKAQTNLEYALDREDNDLQQDLVTLQSMMTRRDNAFSNASKLVKKANDAAQSTIRNIE